LENLGQIEIENGENFLALNVNTNTLYVSNNKSDSILVIDGTAKKVINKIEIEKPRQLVINSDNHTLYAINGDAGFRLRDNGAKISIINTTSNQITDSIGKKEGFGDIKLNQDTNLLYATQTNSKKLWVIDTLTNSVREKISVGAKFRSIAIDSASNTIYLAGRGGMLPNLVFGAIHGSNNDVKKIINKAPWQTKKIWDLYYNPNNKKLYALIEEPGAFDSDSLHVYIQEVNIDSKSFGKRKGGRNEQDRMELDVSKNRIYFSKTLDGELLVLNDSLEEIGLFRFKEQQSFVKKHLKGNTWPTKIAINPELDLIYMAYGKSKLLYIMKGS